MKSKIILVAIVLLFFFTRLYKITENPPSLYWDEASIGYNAYSILQTGKDEWGNFLPLHFRAFGEFKLPVYIYSVAFVQKFIGMNDLSIRLPSVIYWGIAIYLIYLLSKKLFNKEAVALFAAFFLSISSWTFIFSRTGYEASSGVMFFLLGVYLFLSIDKNRWLVICSVISFLLSMYSYNSFRLIIPLTLPVLLYYYFNTSMYQSRNFLRQLMPVVFALFILCIGIFPIIRLFVYDAGTVRFQTVGIYSSNIFEVVANFLTNYFSHFNPDFLFSGDKILRSQQPGMGQVYIFDLPLLIIGIISIVKQKKFIYFIPLMILAIAPVPAAITKESPHALRTIAAVPFISMFSALGLVWIADKLNQKKSLYPTFIIIYLILFANYFYHFLTSYKIVSASEWQYGYKELFLNYKDKFKNYDNIVISDHFGQPYIFALYYLKYNPAKFQLEAILNPVDKWGFSRVAGFDKFIFGKDVFENLPAGKTLGKTLVFAVAGETLYTYEFQK